MYVKTKKVGLANETKGQYVGIGEKLFGVNRIIVSSERTRSRIRAQRFWNEK